MWRAQHLLVHMWRRKQSEVDTNLLAFDPNFIFTFIFTRLVPDSITLILYSRRNYKIHDGDSQLKLSIFLGFISRKVNQRPICYKIPQNSGNIKDRPQWVDKQTLEVRVCGYKGIIQPWPSACVAMQPLSCERRTCMHILNSQQQLSYIHSAGAYASFHVRNARNCSLHM